MEEIRIARKTHYCCVCEKNSIKKNDLYFYTSIRTPRYDKDDNKQIGIEYITFKICEKCNDEAKEDAKSVEINEDFDY